MQAKADDRSDSLRTALRDLMSESEGLVAAIGAEGAQRYRDAVVALERQIRRARDQLDDLNYSASRRARLAARHADAYVHDNPWRAAATGLAVGVAIGFIATLAIARH